MNEKLIVNVAGRQLEVVVESFTGDNAIIAVEGQRVEVSVAQPQAPPAPARPAAQASVSSTPVPGAPSPDQAPSAPAPAAGAKTLASPMPGTVLRIAVEAGQKVKTGDVLLVLEAMKMENEIRSDRTGQVARLLVEPGQQIQTGQAMVEFA